MDGNIHLHPDKELEPLDQIPSKRSHSPSSDVDGTKRARHKTERQTTRFGAPYNAVAVPGAPQLTPPSADMSASSSPSLERAEMTPGAIVGESNASIPRLRSPTERPKSRSTSPKTSPGALEGLQRPMREPIPDFPSSIYPEDVKSLYLALRKASSWEQIIPHEVFGQMTGLGEISRRVDDTIGAAAHHSRLERIHRDAANIASSVYPESLWNTMVHWQMLKLAFPSHGPPQRPTTSTPAPNQHSSSRFTPVRDATIHSRYTLGIGMVDPIAGPRLTTQTGDSTVDFVLAMDAKSGTLLSSFLYALIHDEALNSGVPEHINQSLYRPLKVTPIACSIETKRVSSESDELFQLGKWAGAWYQRMQILRQYLFSQYPVLRDVGHSRERLPTTLLIKIVNHDWHLHFAVDRAPTPELEIHGKLHIGSTATLVEVYQLQASLNAIGSWIETEFQRGIERFLLFNELKSWNTQLG